MFQLEVFSDPAGVNFSALKTPEHTHTVLFDFDGDDDSDDIRKLLIACHILC